MERLVEILGYKLYLATLVGNPAPMTAALGEKMRNPKKGDLVLETSTIYDEGKVGTRLGRLLREEIEPMYTPEEWYADGNEGYPVPTERVWYIERSDGSEYRWVNASFISLPVNLFEKV